jgi:hypothetical protein
MTFVDRFFRRLTPALRGRQPVFGSESKSPGREPIFVRAGRAGRILSCLFRHVCHDVDFRLGAGEGGWLYLTRHGQAEWNGENGPGKL